MNLPENMTLQDTISRAGKNEADAASRLSEAFGWVARIIILMAVVLSPWAFGSVQYWAKFLMAGAVMTGLAFWWFETALNKKDSQVFPYISFLLFAGVLIGLLQLMPLPEFMLGRQTELYERYSVDASVLAQGEAAHDSIKKRMTMFPEGTWYNIQLLLIAAGGVLLGCRFFRKPNHLVLLMAVCTANGAAISFFGLVQKLTESSKGPATIYWVIELANGGTPFGPFVNRNNCAGYLLMCLAAAIGLIVMLTMTGPKERGPALIVSKEIPFWRQFNFHLLKFISELTAPKIAAIMGLVLISTGIVSTLSRGGVMALIIAFFVTLIAYAIAKKPKYTGFIFLPLILLVFLFSGWVGFSDKLISRFKADNTTTTKQETLWDNPRLVQWSETSPAAFESGWLGAGLGSYKHVHRIYRQTPEDEGVFHYAENQYFQSVIEAGWPGFVVYLLAWAVCWYYALMLLFKGTSVATAAPGLMGVFLLSSQGIASFFDFGFYVPSNILMMAVLTGLLAYHAHSLAGRLKKKTLARFQLPNWFVQAALLFVFAGVSLAGLDFYRRWQLDSAMDVKLVDAGPKTLSMEETDKKISLVTDLVRRTSSIEGFNYLGDLWLHRSHLQFYEMISSLESLKSLPPEDRAVMQESRLWTLTNPTRIQENISVAAAFESELTARNMINQAFVQENFPRARYYYQISRSACPLQTVVHARLGILNSVLGNLKAGEADMKRAAEVAPGSVTINQSVALFFLRNGNAVEAAPYMKKCIELQPKRLEKMIRIAQGKEGMVMQPMTNRQIFESAIPDSPALLFMFADKYVFSDATLKNEILDKADALLGTPSQSNRDEILLSADIRLAKGDLEGGLEQLGIALIGDPGDQKTRLRYGILLLEDGQLEEAKEHADFLFSLNSRNDNYINLRTRVDRAIRNEKEQRLQQN